MLRNCWYGNYCSAGKLSPPVGHPQSLPFLLSTAFLFLTHPVFSSLSNGLKFQRLARLLKSSYVLCLKAPPESVLCVQPGWPHFSMLCDHPGASLPSLWVPSAVAGNMPPMTVSVTKTAKEPLKDAENAQDLAEANQSLQIPSCLGAQVLSLIWKFSVCAT